VAVWLQEFKISKLGSAIPPGPDDLSPVEKVESCTARPGQLEETPGFRGGE
jgi:hypothetical protein